MLFVICYEYIVLFLGEFGQQTGDLLNALAFSKGINRTLVVPPWLIYKFDANSVSHFQFRFFVVTISAWRRFFIIMVDYSENYYKVEKGLNYRDVQIISWQPL